MGALRVARWGGASDAPRLLRVAQAMQLTRPRGGGGARRAAREGGRERATARGNTLSFGSDDEDGPGLQVIREPLRFLVASASASRHPLPAPPPLRPPRGFIRPDTGRFDLRFDRRGPRAERRRGPRDSRTTGIFSGSSSSCCSLRRPASRRCARARRSASSRPGRCWWRAP